MTNQPEWPKVRRGRPPKAAGEHFQSFNVYMPPGLFDQLRAEAKRRRVSMAQVIREALGLYFEQG